MFRGSLGRLGQVLVAGGLLASSVVWAQTPPGPAKDELRQKIAEGAEACRKTLGSAPPEVKLGEIEDFCTCMGVQEAAMSEMAGADRTALRPQLQQMCVGIIRKNVQNPASPPASQPASSPPPAAPSVVPSVAEIPRNPFFGLWAESERDCTAASTNEIPDSGNFVFIGEKTHYDRFDRCRITGTQGGGQERNYSLSCYGEGEAKKIASRVTYTLSGSGGLLRQAGAAPASRLMICSRRAPGWVREVGRSLFNVVESDAASSASVASSSPAVATKILSWTLTANGAGAPVAYVRTVPDQMAIRAGYAPTPPIVDALMMYCRAKDSIGLRTILKPGARESRIAINFAGDAFPLALDRQGLAAQKDWAAVAKEWEGIQKGITEADRQRPDYAPHVEILYGKGYQIGGNIDLDGMPQARDRLRAQCAEAIASGVPAGNYRTSGIDGFGEDVVAVSAPTGVLPGSSAVIPKPKAAPDCSAAFERSYSALRRKELDLAGQTGAVMQTQPRFFWNFCPIVQQEIAAAKQIIAAANACPSHRRAASIKAEATTKLAKRQRELARPKCM